MARECGPPQVTSARSKKSCTRRRGVAEKKRTSAAPRLRVNLFRSYRIQLGGPHSRAMTSGLLSPNRSVALRHVARDLARKARLALLEERGDAFLHVRSGAELDVHRAVHFQQVEGVRRGRILPEHV